MLFLDFPCQGSSAAHAGRAGGQPPLPSPQMRGNRQRTARIDPRVEPEDDDVWEGGAYAASLSDFLSVDARTFSLSDFNWPQAARMSRPRGVRIGLA